MYGILGSLLGVFGRRRPVVKPTPPSFASHGYQLGSNDHDEPWIQCLKCGRKSYHPKDIENLYCANDHIFHEYDPTQHP